MKWSDGLVRADSQVCSGADGESTKNEHEYLVAC